VVTRTGGTLLVAALGLLVGTRLLITLYSPEKFAFQMFCQVNEGTVLVVMRTVYQLNKIVIYHGHVWEVTVPSHIDVLCYFVS